MFKRLILIVAIACAVCALGTSLVWPQSKEDGIKLLNEATGLQKKAQSSEDMRRAVEKYEQALRIFEKERDKRNIGSTANNLGLVYKGWGQHAKAVENYEKALGIARELKFRQGEGATLSNLGNVYEDWGQHAKALEYYDKSLAIMRELKHRQGEGLSLINLGNIHKLWNQHGKAVEYYEKSLTIARELKDRESEALNLNNLALVYATWGHYAKALESLEKSLAIARELKDRLREGHTLTHLGSVYRDRGQYEKALEYYDKSLVINRELKDSSGESLSLAGLGNVYRNRGQYAKAVEYLEKSLAVARELKNPRAEVRTLNFLGLVYADWGQYDKAMEYYERCLVIDRELKNPKGEGLMLINIGQIYQYRGEHKNALENFRKGLAIWSEVKVPTGWPKALIADTYMDLGDLPRAEPLLKEANYSPHWGRYYLLKFDYTKAKEYYGKILKSAEENRNVDNLLTAYTGLGAACEGLKDDVEAVENYRKAVAKTEDLRSSIPATERESFFDVKINGFFRTAPYEGLARLMIKMNRPTEAFKESEYTRARIFAEAISRRGEYAGLEVPKEMREKDSLLNDELASLRKNLQKAYEKANKEQIAALEPQVKASKERLATHVDVLRKQYPLFAATRYPQPMGLDKTALRDDEWVLAYHVTDPGLIVYLTKGKQLIKSAFKPFQRKEIDDLVRRFREPLEMKTRDDLISKFKAFDFKTGKKLSDLLLGDVLSSLPKDTPIIIVPDDCLGVLPFEMLPLNDGGKIAADKKIPYATGAEFFGDRNPLSYWQSITALTLARTYGKQKSSKGKLLVLADPVFQMKDARCQEPQKTTRIAGAEANLYRGLMVAMEDGSMHGAVFPRLQLTSTLAENLAMMYQGGAECHVGLQASKERFLKQVAPGLVNYDKIVFATHGYFGKNLPGIREPVLILSLVPPGTDGFLRMSEVTGLKMNADMVALIACQTGLGQRISGEGTMGMGRAFQYAGAKSVLMSLWSVSEKTSTDLLESIFKHMKEGKSKLESLKLARDEIRKQGFDHPFFWAPFILVGETDSR